MKINFSKRFIPILFFIVVIFLFSYYIYDNSHRLHYLLNFSFFSLLMFFFCTIIGILGRGAINCIIYRLFNVKMSLVEGVAVSLMNTLGNLLPFSGGLVAKGVYLKKKHNLAYGHYLPATVSLFVVFIGVNGFIGLIGLLYITKGFQLETPPILFFAFIFMMLAVLSIWIPFPSKIFPEKWQKNLQNIKEGWQGLGQNKRYFLILCCIQIISLVSVAVRLSLIFQMLSLNVALIYCLIFAAASVLTRLVTIAPGGIGVREAIVGGAGYTLGLNFGLSALVVMIDRIIAILICFIISLFYSIIGIKLLR